MEIIGILVAMSQERDALLHFIKQREPAALGPYRCQRFRLGERDCWLLTSGMGIARAARATQVLIEAIHPTLLVSVGVAGGVAPDLGIGDVVVSRNTCQLENSRLSPFQSLAALSEPAWQAVEQALWPRNVRLLAGTAITTRGAQFIDSQDVQMDNPILEMETIGIARIATEKRLPLLSMRAISDGPQSPIPFDLEAALDEQFNLRVGGILKTLLAHPRILPQLLRMGRNTSLAAQNAAIALLAALSRPDPIIKD